MDYKKLMSEGIINYHDPKGSWHDGQRCPRCGRVLNYQFDRAQDAFMFFCDICPSPRIMVTSQMIDAMPREQTKDMLAVLIGSQMARGVEVKNLRRPKPRNYVAADWEPVDGTYPPDWDPDEEEYVVWDPMDESLHQLIMNTTYPNAAALKIALESMNTTNFTVSRCDMKP
jgi:hypothetical protein